jgi:hypothetical protein
MTAEEYFDEHQALWPKDDFQAEGYIDKEDFMRFAELKEEYLTKRMIAFKDETLLLLDHLVANEWNISGGGVTRIKELIATLKASQ